MERRNRAIKALERLQYIDSLDDEQRALLLKEWVEQYIIGQSENLFFNDLTYKEAVQLSELYYKNISFLKKHRVYLKDAIESLSKQRKFFN